MKTRRGIAVASVFDAFPNAIIADDWELCELVENTDIGKVALEGQKVRVIVDEVASGELNNSPSADSVDSDTLLYAMPADLPGFNVSKYIASYYWHQISSDQYYKIREVGLGKNQQKNIIEHVEFRIRPTEVNLDAD